MSFLSHYFAKVPEKERSSAAIAYMAGASVNAARGRFGLWECRPRPHSRFWEPPSAFRGVPLALRLLGGRP